MFGGMNRFLAARRNELCFHILDLPAKLGFRRTESTMLERCLGTSLQYENHDAVIATYSCDSFVHREHVYGSTLGESRDARQRLNSKTRP
jgi:hypothetical protein